MYAVTSPPSRVPTADVSPSFVRAYQTWKGSNIFCLQGRLVFGPDVRSLALTILLIVVPVAVFCVFVGRKLIDDFAHRSGVWIIVAVAVFTFYDLILLLLTSGRDPGIVPRNAHPPEPEGYEGSSDVVSGQTPPLRLPRTKDVTVNGVTLKVKYCDTCMLYRPPRCSHCSICNNCVEKFDHHCPWVGQCIGLRNYRFFFMFVSSTTLICLYVHGFCWVYVRRIMDSEGISIWKAMIKTPASIVLIIYTFICVWFVGGLTFFHLYLISTNQSTYENFRYRYDGRVNPYNRGILANFLEVFCTSIPPSKNNFRAKVPKDPEIQPRVAGGSFPGSEMEKSGRDMEMGRKTVWGEDAGQIGDYEGQIGYNNGVDKDGGLGDTSPELSRNLPTENAEGNFTQNPRRSSWGRRSGSLDISPEVRSFAASVGESRRMTGGGDDNLSPDAQHSRTNTRM